MASSTTSASPFSGLMERIPGLQAIIVSDKDGVPVMQAQREGSDFPAYASGDAVFNNIADQVSRMGIGAVNSTVCQFDQFVVVHAALDPLVLSMVASQDVNVGVLLALVPDLSTRLESVRKSAKGVQSSSGSAR